MAITKENPFKDIERPFKEVPPEMRKKVMADVATAKLIIDMLSLFTNNYSSTVESLLKSKKENI